MVVNRPRAASAQDEAVFQSVRRACYASLDSVSLRQEVARRARPLLRQDAFALTVLDPDTGLVTHVVGEGISAAAVDRFMREIYPYEEALHFPALARSGQVVEIMPDYAEGKAPPLRYHSEAFLEMMRDEGIAHEIRGAFTVDDEPWGVWCVMRRAESGRFGEREAAFLRRIGPHLARGLRTAMLRDLALASDAAEADAAEPAGADADDAVPGVVVVDAGGRIMLRNAVAAARLEDLADVGVGRGELPTCVLNAVGEVRARHAAQAGSDAPLDAEARVRGSSGVWYRLCASLSEPDARGESQVVVTFAPLGRSELAPLLARLYNLTPREREVAALAARGESTQKIATRLGLSQHTVLDYLYSACDKIGVRGRRKLVAKLYFDACLPRMAG